MAGKHTSGPWSVTQSGIRDSGGYIAHTNAVFRYEGQDQRYAYEVAQREADKCLIAAAPDLLEALQELVDDIADRFDMDHPSTNPGIKSAVANARAAITRATQPLPPQSEE